ncbi:unnamed protein product, partial [Adineta steineri]
MATEQAITMVTLGRPFHLGMLYDVRSDKLITGVTLWDPQILANHTITHKQPYTGYEIITEDSLQDKAHALGVEASLKLSLLGGLMSISGSAKYAEDYQRTNNGARLTLKYSTTTHFQQLTMDHLGKGNLDYLDLLDTDVATHVVTGVVYGAEAFFIFDRTVSKGESKEEVSNSLKAIFNKSIFENEEEANLNLTDQEKKYVHKLHCKFYSDFHLNENPNTYDEAVKMYRQLPLLLGVNNENAIPKKVWLYPLHLLDNNVTRIVREIPSNLVDYSISTIENLRSLEVRALDSLENSIFTSLNHMKKQLLDFTAQLSEMQRYLKESIALYLPKLRGNTDVKESVLFNLFKQVDSSPFHKRTLESWLEEKEKEITLMTTWIENLAKDRNLDILIKSSSLDEVIDDTRYDYILCLSLRLVEKNDPQLTFMDNYLHNMNHFNSSSARKKHIPWFENSLTMAEIRKNLRQFKEFAEANNVKNTKIRFIVNEVYSFYHIKTVEVNLYNGGSEKEGFIVPSKPDAPYAISVTDNNVTLTWADPATGTEEVRNYKVMYQKHRGKTLVGKNKSKKDEQWAEVYTNANHKKIIISNLPPSSKFVFKVQSITTIGLSAISACSKPIKTFAKKVKQTTTTSTTISISTTTSKPATTTTTTTTMSISTTTSKSATTTTMSISTTTSKSATTTTSTSTATTSTATTIKVSKFKKWKQNATTVAGGNEQGDGLHQLAHPYGIFIDEKKNIFIADLWNHRIVEWKYNAKEGKVIAGGNGKGNRMDRLNGPTDIIVDEQNHSITIADFGNRRVIQWSNQNQQILIQNIQCWGLAIDKNGFFYVSDWEKHEVRRWKMGEYNNEGIIVAGGNGKGDQLHQLSYPT